ncbi:MAG: carbon starvation protein A [Desulfobacteraceae bacterium]|nr:carbon starvation protein A [Desulfobacteraceae bacterium]MBU4055296.1 carbon starvation protein A [Pseudomonadota bacterium]
MSLLFVIGGVAAILALAYRLYGGFLVRLFHLDPETKTPATLLRDDIDYVPIAPHFLFGQHFSAIAAAGPIVGPIVAGVAFGWGPALAWILIGAIFIGGVHDFTSLVASIRHQACSITEVVRLNMTRRAYLLFLGFIWIALVYIIVAFTDITAQSFVGKVTLEDGSVVTGAGIATSSLLYLALPVVMGLLIRYTRLSVTRATIIFLPLVGVAIWAGQKIPFSVESMLNVDQATAVKIWDVALLSYCYFAGIVPMWMLLQPRGHLGGCFLYAAIIGAAAGLMVGGNTVQYPAFNSWSAPNGDTLFPFLFITIACGACSGFHAIVASGTSSKQLRSETDAKPVGYGAMLLEALVAAVSLACVMMLAFNDPMVKKAPNFIYANGIGEFLGVFGVAKSFGISFGLLAFATFVYDTLDICTRLGRYIIEELLGWKSRMGRWTAAAIMAATPLLFVMRTETDVKGNVIPVWKAFWTLFGASNQLLAALTLLGVTVWLVHQYRAKWIWFVMGVPTAFMYVMSVWALGLILKARIARAGWWADAIPWVAGILILLAALMLFEAILILIRIRQNGVKGHGSPIPIQNLS